MSKWDDLMNQYPTFKDVAEDAYQAVKERLITDGMVLRQDVVVNVPVPVTPAPEKPVHEPETEFPDGLIWLDRDISQWPVTTELSLTVSGNRISIYYGKRLEWKEALMNGAPFVGNIWAVVQYKGQWYASTWDWLRRTTTVRSKSDCGGTNFEKKAIPKGWMPSGKVGLFVSTPVRGNISSGQKERSNVVWVEW